MNREAPILLIAHYMYMYMWYEMSMSSKDGAPECELYLLRPCVASLSQHECQLGFHSPGYWLLYEHFIVLPCIRNGCINKSICTNQKN